jgi:hypothetical protein
LETKYLEEQTKKMEDKLTELKKQIEEQKKLKAEMYIKLEVGGWIPPSLAGKRLPRPLHLLNHTRNRF